METTFPEIFTAKNKMVTSGLLIEAAEKYFAPTIRKKTRSFLITKHIQLKLSSKVIALIDIARSTRCRRC